MELFEQLRREYEFGIGTVAGRGGEVRRAPPDGAPGAGRRAAAAAALPAAGQAQAGRGGGVHRRGAGGGPAGAAQAAAHGAAAPSADAEGVPGRGGRGVDGAQPRARAPAARWAWCGARPSCRRAMAWGQEAQVDWYEAWADLGGERTKVQVFAMRSMASGAAFHRAYLHATQQAFLEAHERGVRLLRRRVPPAALRQPGERGAQDPARAPAGGDGAVRGVPLALAVRGGVLHARRGARERRRRGRGRLLPAQPPGPGAGRGRPRRAERPAAGGLPGGRGAGPGWPRARRSARRWRWSATTCCARAAEGFDLAEVAFPLVDKQGCVTVKTNAYSVPARAGSRVEARVHPLHVEVWHGGRPGGAPRALPRPPPAGPRPRALPRRAGPQARAPWPAPGRWSSGARPGAGPPATTRSGTGCGPGTAGRTAPAPWWRCCAGPGVRPGPAAGGDRARRCRSAPATSRRCATC